MQSYRQDSEHFDALGNVVLGILRFVMRSWGTAVEVFLRREFGAEYLGTQAVGVLLLIPLYIAACERFDPRPMLVYLGVYLLLCFWHRVNVLRRSWRGEHGHRFYNGIPRLWRICPRCSEMTMKQVIEPLAVLGVGMLLMPILPSIGVFVIVGGFCSAFLNIEWNIRMQKRAKEMHDAVIEQQVIAERFREMQDRR